MALRKIAFYFSGPPVPNRRRHSPHHEDAQVPLPHAPHHRAVQPAQVPRQTARPQETNRVSHRQGLHGERQRQSQPIQLRGIDAQLLIQAAAGNADQTTLLVADPA